MSNVVPDYYIARHSSRLILTFECLSSVIILSGLAALNLAGTDRSSLWVYLLAAGLHSALETVATASGVRRLDHPILFGFPARFPLASVIIGFFEGGLVSLAGYQFARGALNHDHRSWIFFACLATVFGGLGAVGGAVMRSRREAQSAASDLTRRRIFSAGSVGLLVAFFVAAGGYVVLPRTARTHAAAGLAWYLAGVAIFLAVLIVPLHVFGVRLIQKRIGDRYVRAALPEQVLIMYPFNVVFEAGWYALHFILIYAVGLLTIA